MAIRLSFNNDRSYTKLTETVNISRAERIIQEIGKVTTFIYLIHNYTSIFLF